MATLSVAERREIWGNFMRMLSAEGENIPGIVKNDLLNAVNGLDNLMNASEETIKQRDSESCTKCDDNEAEGDAFDVCHHGALYDGGGLNNGSR